MNRGAEAEMLARRPDPSSLDFETLLILPPKPDTIRLADEAWRKAVAERQAGQARHIEAVHQFERQKPGQPITLTRAEVDEMGAALGPLFEAEAAAATARDEARNTYQADVNQKLAGSLESYREAIAESLNRLESLLQSGAMLHTASVAANVKLPSNVPGLAPHIAKTAVHMARQIMAKAR